MRRLAYPIALLAAPLTAAAAGETPGVLTLHIENDVFAGIDNQYTHGTYLRYTLPLNDLPGWARWARGQLRGVIDAPDWQVTYGLGQTMLTPDDITNPDPPLDDRPYAGLLYGSVFLTADTGRRLDTLGLEIGVTGPPSLAGETQKFIHNDLGLGDPPNGWDTQIGTELTFRVLYEQKRRYSGTLWGFETDAIPEVTLAAGTADTSAGAGLTLRLGEGLAMDYGPPRVRRSVATVLRPNSGNDWRWNLSAGFTGRAVARDIFLEGNTFRDSRSVPIEPFVAEGTLGVTVDFGPAVVSYTHAFRSPDFEGLDRWVQFGALAVRVPF